MLTLEELLASILLEERLVNDRTGQIVNHELKHGLNLLLSVTGIVGDGSVL